MKSDQAHWNRIFRETEEAQLGWHEHDFAPTFRLLEEVPRWRQSTIFLAGAGMSRIIEMLLDAAANLAVNDISRDALSRVKNRLGEAAGRVRWICRDLAQPLGPDIPPADIWIDRAVLHFLTDESDIEGYFRNLRAVLNPGGHVILAEFAPDGAPVCAGLDIHRYSVEELSERLGPGFELVDRFDHTYINPEGGPRPYLYALFRHAPGWRGDAARAGRV